MKDVKQIEDKAGLEAEFKAACDKLVVVDFFADWCGPCRQIAPKIKEMANEENYSHVVFLKLNVDEDEDAAADYKVEALPTFIVFKDGKEAGRLVGASVDKLKEKIAEVHSSQASK